jgi:hypothetical protein
MDKTLIDIDDRRGVLFKKTFRTHINNSMGAKFKQKFKIDIDNPM